MGTEISVPGEHGRRQMSANRHDFIFLEVGELEQARDALMSEVVPAQIGKLPFADGIAECVNDASARLDRKG